MIISEEDKVLIKGALKMWVHPFVVSLLPPFAWSTKIVTNKEIARARSGCCKGALRKLLLNTQNITLSTILQNKPD